MGGIVEAAFWGIAGRLVICFVLLPAGLILLVICFVLLPAGPILLGYLIFIFGATLYELWKQRRK